MTTFKVKKTQAGEITGFKISGHAGYDEYGKDILCAAISTLVINFINSVEELTDIRFSSDSNEKKGIIDFDYVSKPDDKAKLLFDSLMLGLRYLQIEFGDKLLKIID